MAFLEGVFVPVFYNKIKHDLIYMLWFKINKPLCNMRLVENNQQWVKSHRTIPFFLIIFPVLCYPLMPETLMFPSVFEKVLVLNGNWLRYVQLNA